MAGADFSNIIRQNLSAPGVRTSQGAGFRVPSIQDLLRETPAPAPTPSGAAAAGRLQEAGLDPSEGEEFSFLESLFNILDIPGRTVRNVGSAAISAFQGEFGEAMERVEDAALSPIDAITFNLFDLREAKDNVTGSDILDQLGWKAGTTTEDERRIRIAMEGGLSRRAATQKYGVFGDRLLEGETAQEFAELQAKVLAKNPEFDVNASFEDAKNAIDGQDFAGFALEILADPLTYLSGGLTAAGKAAKSVSLVKKVAPKLHLDLVSKTKLSEAIDVVKNFKGKGLTGKTKEKLIGDLTKASDDAGNLPSLFLADNFSAQTREGQRSLLRTWDVLGGKTLIQGQHLSDVLSHLGVSKTKRELITGKVLKDTAGKRQYFDLPIVQQAVGGIRGMLDFARDKFSNATGVQALDNLLQQQQVDAVTSLTKANRDLVRFQDNMISIAEEAKVSSDDMNRWVSNVLESMKRDPDDPRLLEDIASLRHIDTALSDNQKEQAFNIAAGIMRLNQDVADRLNQVPVRFNNLTDDSIEYLHRIKTDQADAWFKKEGLDAANQFFKDNGLEFSARSKTFRARDEKAFGKTIEQINREFKEKHKVEFDLFNTDPILATRESLRQSQRALSNAKFVAGVVDEFGIQNSAVRQSFLEGLGQARAARTARTQEKVAKAAEKAGVDLPAGVDASKAKFDSEQRPVAVSLLENIQSQFDEAYTEFLENKGGIADVSSGSFEKARKEIAGAIQKMASVTSHSQISKNLRKVRKDLSALIPAGKVPTEFRKLQGLLQSGRDLSGAARLIRRGVEPARENEAVVKTLVRQLGTADPESWGPEGINTWVRGLVDSKQLVDPIGAHQVSAFDLYKSLGLKLPDTFDETLDLIGTGVPKAVADVAARATAIQKDPSEFVKKFDDITRWVKASVTVLWPGFFGRNMLENFYKGFVAGNTSPTNYHRAARFLANAVVDVENVPKFADAAWQKGNKLAKSRLGPIPETQMKELSQLGVGDNIDEVMDWLESHGILQNKVTSEFGEDLVSGAAGRSKGARTRSAIGGLFKQLGTEGGAIRTGFKLNGATEDWHRMALFFHEIDRGQTAVEAAQKVKDVFFDYRNLTNFESGTMKRTAMFYSFYKHNLRYIPQQAANNPALTKQVTRLFQNDPDNPRHSWMSDMGSFKVGSQEVSLGFLPQQQFGMLNFGEGDVYDKLRGKFRDVGSAANPLVTAPLEMMFNKDLFTDRPLTSDLGSAQEWSYAPPGLQKMLGVEKLDDGTYRISNTANLIMNAVPALRRFATTASQFTREDRRFWQALTKTMSGVNSQDRDFKKEDITLLSKRLRSGARQADLISTTAVGNLRIDETKLKGRVLSALYSPSQTKMENLALIPEVASEVFPYATLNDDGSVRLTQPFRQKLREVALRMFPKQAALLDAQKVHIQLKKQVKEDKRTMDLLSIQAKEENVRQNTPMASSAQISLAQLLGGR